MCLAGASRTLPHEKQRMGMIIVGDVQVGSVEVCGVGVGVGGVNRGMEKREGTYVQTYLRTGSTQKLSVSDRRTFFLVSSG